MANEDTASRTRIASEENSRVEIYKQREQGFVASFIDTDVASNGGTINMQITNPSDSGFDIDVVKFLFTSQFKGQFAVYDQFSSAPSGGSSVPVDNLLMDSGGDNGSTAGGVTINRGVNFTSADSPHYDAVLPTGGMGANTGGGAGTATEPLIEPGREIVLELTNNSTSNAPGSLGVVYLERDDTYGKLNS